MAIDVEKHSLLDIVTQGKEQPSVSIAIFYEPHFIL